MHDCDVLVVGGGPTGTTLALIAAQHGAHAVVCEKDAAIYPLPRAAHIDHETMRIFQSLGAADDIAATCRTTSSYDFLTASGEVLLRFEGSDRIGEGGWPRANMIHQPSVERVLRARFADQRMAGLRSQWRYLDHADLGDAVEARFATPDGERRVTARYLVGADGARSAVRRNAGFEVEDLEFDEPWLVIDALVHDRERLPKVNLQICDPARPTTCVLMGEGRHRWEFMLLPGETAEQVTADSFIARLLEPWKVEGAVTLERRAVYRFHAAIAKTWRKGRVLLAGDAAHQTPPFAGQGMCAGVRDAANLGWKLALAASGGAAALLDTYQSERAPHVRATIQMAIMMGRTVCITDRVAAAARDAQMIAARQSGHGPDGAIAYPAIEQGLVLAGSSAAGGYFPQPVAPDGSRLDDLAGPHAWLVGTKLATPDHVTPVDLDDPRFAGFAPSLGSWLGANGAEAVLVRPDRYVFGTGRPAELLHDWSMAVDGLLDPRNARHHA